MVCVVRPEGAWAIDEEALKTNTPSADALMSGIRNQFPFESEEQHRKRNGTKWRLEDQRGNCEEPVCRLLKPRLSMSIPFGRGRGHRAMYR
jgi:hypothetical protein